MKGDSGQWRRAASSRFSVPTAFTSKSSKGMLAARSCEGWAAVWMMTAGLSVSTSFSTAGAVANVQLVVREAGQRLPQPLLVPAGVALRAEEASRWLLSTP